MPWNAPRSVQNSLKLFRNISWRVTQPLLLNAWLYKYVLIKTWWNTSKILRPCFGTFYEESLNLWIFCKYSRNTLYVKVLKKQRVQNSLKLEHFSSCNIFVIFYLLTLLLIIQCYASNSILNHDIWILDSHYTDGILKTNHNISQSTDIFFENEIW